MNEFHDQLSIDTPEQVQLHFPVSGIGSRFLAVLMDQILQGLLYFLVGLVLYVIYVSAPTRFDHMMNKIPDSFGPWVAGVFIFFAFCLYWGYYTIFEIFWNGQTPGKRIMKIRVIKESGRQVTFFESMIRNLVRVIDYLPSFYLVGIITMALNRQQKRLGDFAAGTLVVHEQRDLSIGSQGSSRIITSGVFNDYQPGPDLRYLPDNAALAPDAVARLSPDDLNTIDTFFARAIDFDVDIRANMAARLLSRLAVKMRVTPPPGVNPEHVLESIAYTMRGQGQKMHGA